MLPSFPNFKKISLDDREFFEIYNDKHLPSSSFNFTNVWAWDTKGKRMISELNNNLVLHLAAYDTPESFLTFLGTNKVEDTARRLIQFAIESKISPVLRFLSEEVVHELKANDICVDEDVSSFDYIFPLSQFANPQGAKFKTKRHLANKFQRENPSAIFETKDLSDVNVQKEIITVLRRWEINKKNDTKICDLEHEEIAIDRILQTASKHNLALSVIYLNNVMLSFSIDEILPNKYVIAHFTKADNSFKGINEFFNEKISRYLLNKGALLWNWQQDLNIEGLRQLKMSYHPVSFLKKYNVSLS